MVDIVDTIYSDVQSHPFTTPKRISKRTGIKKRKISYFLKTSSKFTSVPAWMRGYGKDEFYFWKVS